MKKVLFIIAALLAVGLLSTGCQKPPTEELAGAQQALSAIDEAVTKEYAAAEFDEAAAALDAANAEIEAQGERFALVRSYDHAKELLAQAVEKADAAHEAATAAKAEAKAVAEAAVADLRTALEGATADLTALGECRRKPKGFAADLEVLTGRLEALGGEVAPIEEALAAEAFGDASAATATLSESVTALGADLHSAREKLGC